MDIEYEKSCGNVFEDLGLELDNAECPLCQTTKRELIKLKNGSYGCPFCYYLYNEDGSARQVSKSATFTTRKRIYNNLLT